MKYKLLRTRYIAVMAEIARSREFDEGTVFKRAGKEGGYIVLEKDGDFFVVNSDTLQQDFEQCWGDTCLFR